MNDVSVFLEHVDFLNGLDGLDIQFLERSLELLIVGSGRLVDLLRLTAGSTFASIKELVTGIPKATGVDE